MNETIITNWNQTVGPDAIAFHPGNFCKLLHIQPYIPASPIRFRSYSMTFSNIKYSSWKSLPPEGLDGSLCASLKNSTILKPHLFT